MSVSDSPNWSAIKIYVPALAFVGGPLIDSSAIWSGNLKQSLEEKRQGNRDQDL